MSREDLVKYQFTSVQSRSEAAENGRKGGKKKDEKLNPNLDFTGLLGTLQND